MSVLLISLYMCLQCQLVSYPFSYGCSTSTSCQRTLHSVVCISSRNIWLVGKLLVKHFYCNFCLSSVDEDLTFRPNTRCAKMFSDHQAKSYFLEISVSAQLQNMFKKGEFSSLLSHRLNRVCIDDLCSRRELVYR